MAEETITTATRSTGVVEGLLGAIGNTPLIEINSLSQLTGCRILAKAEFLNPGGSIKDRTAKWLISEAEQRGLLKKGSQIFEATGGNTGIGLAIVAAARGYSTCFTMPSNISQDKINLMQTLGARVVLQPVVPFDDPQHYYHTAERLAKEENAVFLNQFENLSNYSAHFNSTAPEIWSQTQGNVDAFVASAGTGGTISGCSNYLKEKNPNVQVFLVDPPGSGLLSYLKDGTFESQGSSLTEGIGIKRLTANFAKAKVDGSFFCSDRETVEMAYFLLRRDGIFVGPSAALNCVGAVKAARRLNKPGATIVTILCDGGERYRNTLYSRSCLEEKQLTPSPIPDAEADTDPLAFVLL